VRVRDTGPELHQLGFALVAVGFSPPEALASLARHLGWTDPFCSDEGRQLYDRLGLGKATSGQVFTPGTRAVYSAAAERGVTAEKPVEDVRQLGGDTLVVDGVARLTYRPASPDDRPAVVELLAGARSLS
jgi:peroxiredoxin